LSYLSGRTQFVRYSGATSSVASVSCGVPQGSVLGPVLFIMYVADVIKLVEDHSTPVQSSELTSCIEECINQVQAWMASNRLCLNPTKTEFIWLGTARRRQQLTNDKVSLSSVCLQPSERVRGLGVEVDCDLSMAAHVGHITSLCFFHLRSGFCGAHSPLMQHTV